MTHPIVILSFNRPRYFQRVIDSLAAQQCASIRDRDVFLFQDGCRNSFSGVSYCGDNVVRDNIEYFSSRFPRGTVFPSASNLGVALNFERAESFTFDDLRAEAGLFFEDDLVLGPRYLAILDRLIAMCLESHNIGYASAYGNHRASLREQQDRIQQLTRMQHFWGFGETRRQWLLEKPWRDSYLDLVRDRDYRLRDHKRIAELFRSWSLGVPGTSRDVARSHACVLSDTARINTFACYARYIGARGVHFTPRSFARMGFDRTKMIIGVDPAFSFPEDDFVSRILDEARLAAAHSHPSLCRLLGQASDNPSAVE